MADDLIPVNVRRLAADPVALPSASVPVQVSRNSWTTLAITSLVGFMVSLEITIIALALPRIREAFPEAAEATLSWVITAYNIGVASLLVIAGWMADRFGRRLVFLIGLAFFLVGSVAAGAAPSVEVLIGARVVQAVGGAMQFPAGLALLLNAFPPDRRQVAIGIWGAMGGLAAAVGPSLGALLVDAFGWRAVFLINVPVAVAALLLGRRVLDESRGEGVPDRVDLIGVPLASLGVGSVVLGIVQGDTWGWADGRTLGSFVVGLLLVAVFVMRSRTHLTPLFDLGLFRIRSYTVGNVGGVFFVVAFFSWLVLLPTFVQSAWEWSVLRTGFAIAPGPLVAMLVSPLAGRFAERRGHNLVLSVGGVFGALGVGLHLVLTDVDPAYVSGLLIPGMLIGVAAGCSFAMLVGASMRDVPPRRFGMGGAGRTTAFQLSIAVGIAIAFAIVGRPASSEQFLDRMQISWLVALGCFVLQAVTFALVFPRASDDVVA